jgi:hypothetical protein
MNLRCANQRFLAEFMFSALIIAFMKKLSLFAPSVIMTGALFLGACGGSSKPAETTVAAGDTAAVVTEPTSETTAAAQTTVAAAESPSSVAAPDATETTVAAAGGANDSEQAVKAMAAALGITEKKDLDCITSKIDLTAPPAAGGVDPNMIKALISCQPPALVEAAKGQLVTRLPNATPEQIECIARVTLTVLADSDGDMLSALSGGATALPPELQSKFLEKAKSCGLSEDDLKKAVA